MRDSPPDGQPGAASSSAVTVMKAPARHHACPTVRLSLCWARRRVQELGGHGQGPVRAAQCSHLPSGSFPSSPPGHPVSEGPGWEPGWTVVWGWAAHH